MKTAILALGGLLAVSGAALADYEGLKQSYVADAFADADNDWRRITVNRVSDCGAFGKQGHRRIGVLIDRYNAIGKGLSASDSDAVGDAAKRFNAAVTANARFEKCWSAISRAKAVDKQFLRALSDI